MSLPAILLDAPLPQALPSSGVPPAALPDAEGFSALLQSHFPAVTTPMSPPEDGAEPDEDEAVDPMSMLAAPPIDLLQVCQGAPPAAAEPAGGVNSGEGRAGPQAMAVAQEESAPASPPTEAPTAAGEASAQADPGGELPQAEGAQQVSSQAASPSAEITELAELPPARGVERVEAARAAPAVSEAPASASAARESEVQLQTHGLDKLSLKISEGGERFDVDIERGVDRSLDVRVVAPPEAVDELWSMESELQQSLEEKALKLGSYSAEARDPDAEADADAAGDSESEAGAEREQEVAGDEPVAAWQGGVLNIRA